MKRHFFVAILLILITIGCQINSRFTRVAEYPATVQIDDVIVHNNLAFVNGRWNGLLIILDVFDPSKPRKVGQFSFAPENLWSITVNDDFVYAATKDGLHILDVSDPANPTEVGRYQTHSDAFIGSIAILGDYAYLAQQEDGLRVINISDPTKPIEQGGFQLNIGFYVSAQPPEIKDVWVVDNYLYVTGRTTDEATSKEFPFDIVSGMWVLDVTNPRTPKPIYHTEQVAIVLNMVIKDDIAYVVDRVCLCLFDVSNPEIPTLLGRYDINSQDVTVIGKYAFVAKLTSLTAIDVSNPKEMVEVDSYPAESQQIQIVEEAKGMIYAIDNFFDDDYQRKINILEFK